jgi:uncharacterized RDD family membrane protein YckC
MTEPAPSRTVALVAESYPWSIVVRRWAATLVDYLLIALSFTLLLAVPEDRQVAASALLLALAVAYYIVLEHRYGATLGKLAFGLRIVDATGAKPTYGQASVRTLLRLIEVNPLAIGGIPAAIAVIASKRRQRLGDMAAQTFVLKSGHLAGPLALVGAPAAGSASPPALESPWRDDRDARMLLPIGRSGKAITAGYLGLFALLMVPAPLAIYVSVRALHDFRRHPEQLGRGRAVFGLVMGVLGTVGLIVVAVNWRAWFG